MEELTQILLEIVQDLPKTWGVFILAAVPVTELRAAIPVAIAWGLSPGKAFVLAFLGNLAPAVPLLLLLGPVAKRLEHFQVFRTLFSWLFERTRKYQGRVEKYGFLGLTLFVGIPAPGTGVWTGSVLAFLLGISFIPAFTAMMLGVLLAGTVVTAASLGLFKLADVLQNQWLFLLVLLLISLGIYWYQKSSQKKEA